MNESFLHYVWQYQYFDKIDLTTVAGEIVSVFNPGMLNSHAGPDFSNARVKINDVEWFGTVEIHINASDWMSHKHHEDFGYENVILHVVWKNDKPVKRMDGSLIPTIELKDRIDEQLLLGYKKLIGSPESIPCAKSFPLVDELIKVSMLDKALFHRLERKAKQIQDTLAQNQNDWEETCYQTIGGNFGFKVNTEPFQQLVRTLPYKILLKHSDKQEQVEALLFGQAGFLDEKVDHDYFSLLKREHDVLSRKYNLTEKKLHVTHWRFLRLRPANFPTIRIAQFAVLILSVKNIFSRILDAKTYDQLIDLLSVQQSSYWQYHYQFNEKEIASIPPLGKMSIDNIIINTIVPLLVAYGKSRDEQEWIDGAISILNDIPAEGNAIIKKWKNLKQPVQTAFDSQALIELYNNFCLKRKCLDCTLGAFMIKPVQCLTQ
jgi:hypothetical protein